ncbi:aldo/keto reductase, partial [Candidatus Pelagibacter sp.]|nr:aldo/keto reductase [Candidatus Pelagibacter sp.]
MKIVLGTANFNSLYGVSNKKIDKIELKKIINYCVKNNIYYLDTADAYNNYQLIKTFNLKKFKIITKLSNLKKIKKNNLKKYIINNLTNLLKNLNVK